MTHQACTDPAGAGSCQFLRGDDFHELVGGHAAVFLWETEPQQSYLGRLDVQGARKFSDLVPFGRIWFDLAGNEAAHHVAKCFVIRRIKWALSPRTLKHFRLPLRP